MKRSRTISAARIRAYRALQREMAPVFESFYRRPEIESFYREIREAEDPRKDLRLENVRDPELVAVRK